MSSFKNIALAVAIATLAQSAAGDACPGYGTAVQPLSGGVLECLANELDSVGDTFNDEGQDCSILISSLAQNFDKFNAALAAGAASNGALKAFQNALCVNTGTGTQVDKWGSDCTQFLDGTVPAADFGDPYKTYLSQLQQKLQQIGGDFGSTCASLATTLGGPDLNPPADGSTPAKSTSTTALAAATTTTTTPAAVAPTTTTTPANGGSGATRTTTNANTTMTTTVTGTGAGTTAPTPESGAVSRGFSNQNCLIALAGAMAVAVMIL